MVKARRMALVPEEDIFKADELKVNTSPVVKSLTNMDQEIKAILEDTTMPPDRKVQLYDSIMNGYRNILNQYRSKIPYVRVLPKPKRKKRKRAPLPHRLERPFSQHLPPRKRKRKKKKKKHRCYWTLHLWKHSSNFHHPWDRTLHTALWRKRKKGK